MSAKDSFGFDGDYRGEYGVSAGDRGLTLAVRVRNNRRRRRGYCVVKLSNACTLASWRWRSIKMKIEGITLFFFTWSTGERNIFKLLTIFDTYNYIHFYSKKKNVPFMYHVLKTQWVYNIYCTFFANFSQHCLFFVI